MRIYAWQNIFPAWCCYSEAAVSECRDSKLLAKLPAGSWHMTLGKQSFSNLKIPKNNGGKIIFKDFKGPICNLSDVLFSIYYSEYFPTSKLNRNLDYSNWQINLIWSRTQGFYGKTFAIESTLHGNINTGSCSPDRATSLHSQAIGQNPSESLTKYRINNNDQLALSIGIVTFTLFSLSEKRENSSESINI